MRTGSSWFQVVYLTLHWSCGSRRRGSAFGPKRTADISARLVQLQQMLPFGILPQMGGVQTKTLGSESPKLEAGPFLVFEAATLYVRPLDEPALYLATPPKRSLT